MPKKSNKKRPDGRIAVQVYLGRVDGKRKVTTVYGRTQKEADQKAAEVKAQLGKGMDLSVDNTLQVWADRWTAMKANETSPAQARAYRARIGYFTEALGHLPILSVRLHDLQAIIDALAKENPHTHKPTAKKTLADIAKAAKQLFDYAAANRVMDHNPAEYLRVPQNAPKMTRRVLNEQEVSRVTETPHRAQTAAMIMLYSGLRRGEVAALTWNDIDLQAGTITVSKAADYKSGPGGTVKAPKTAAGNRVVPIPTFLNDYLQSIPKTSILVFPSKAGTMMSEPAWQRLWRYYMNEMNRRYADWSRYVKAPDDKSKKLPMLIQPFTPHCLRHTYCTMLYESGIDVVVAQRLMGHADIKTTLGIYTHLSDARAHTEVSKLDEYINIKSQFKSAAAEPVDT